MRVTLVIPLVLLAAACNVSKEGNAVTVQYDQNTAQNTVADLGNTAQNIATDIGNDVQKTGDKIENKVGNTDVSVKVGQDQHTDTTKTTTTTENKSK